jgi:hypothetical protein
MHPKLFKVFQVLATISLMWNGLSLIHNNIDYMFVESRCILGRRMNFMVPMALLFRTQHKLCVFLSILGPIALCQVQDCTDSFKTCIVKYKTNVLPPLNSNDRTKICRVYRELKQCLTVLDCPIQPEAKIETIEKYGNSLRDFKYDCDSYQEPTAALQETSTHVDKESQKCNSMLNSCKRTYQESLYPFSGQNDPTKKEEIQSAACKIARTYMICTRPCGEKKNSIDIKTSVCREFQLRNISCDLISCGSIAKSAFNTSPGVHQQLDLIVTLIIVSVHIQCFII